MMLRLLHMIQVTIDQGHALALCYNNFEIYDIPPYVRIAEFFLSYACARSIYHRFYIGSLYDIIT